MTETIAPAARRRDMRLPDGRRFAWHEWGPAGGRPVIFCTGAAMSGSLGFGAARQDEGVLKEGAIVPEGLRLIAPDRPGLGGSDPYPDKTLMSWAADVGALIEEQALEDPCAVGFSQGAPFALALAQAGSWVHAGSLAQAGSLVQVGSLAQIGRGPESRRSLVRAVALVSGQDELGHPALRDKLRPEVAGMLAALRDDPDALLRQIAPLARAEAFRELVIGMSGPLDRAFYQAPGFAAAYRQCLEEGFAQGPEGYLRDLVIALGPWPFAPEEIAVPVDLWYGALDTSPVHSPDFGATLEARLPRGWRCVDPEAGGAILWMRAGDILRRLVGRG